MSTAITINRPEALADRAADAPRSDHATPRLYWNNRAERFARHGAGLQAVCSYGMPAFYNWQIDLVQRRALGRWLTCDRTLAVLEIGCGVGRWSRRLARAGHDVVGLDWSTVMIQEATERARSEGVAARCRFVAGDLVEMPFNRRFDRIFGVTVLQHVLNGDRLHTALGALAASLASDGEMVLLEAAPTGVSHRCDSDVFVARTEREYSEAFAAAGLQCVAVHAVDPAPFKIWFLPWYGRLPRVLAVGGLFAVTAAALPIDLLLRRWGRATSWHKVFVLRHAGDRRR